MDTGIIVLIISFGIPALAILFIFMFIRRNFAKNKKFADELKKRFHQQSLLMQKYYRRHRVQAEEV
jgi:uncharacterized protein YoxC